MEVLLGRKIAVSLVMAVAAVTLAMLAALVVVAEPAQARHGEIHRAQPSSPPGNSDLDVTTGRSNRVIRGDR